MKARKKPLEETTLADFGVTVASRTRVLKLEPPARRKAGVRVKTSDELLDKLQHEAKVI
jgi:electron transfer flavoprotein beta subunit